MLTVALLLGSKFLDDNTFQNKSWSEVSGISVKDLNTLEYEWLSATGWCLYVNLDKSEDYNAWLKNWRDWLQNKKRQQAQTNHERLVPLVPSIEADVGRSGNPHVYSSWHQQQVAEYERLSSLKRNQHAQTQTYRREPWFQPTAWHPPLTPPDSGYGTPEYSNSAMNSEYTPWFDRAIVNSANAQRQQYHHQAANYNTFHRHATLAHTTRNHSNYPAYYNYNPAIWDPSVADCTCSSCVGPVHNKPQNYFTTQSYGQPVMG
jgi:hypothetical protein